MRYLISIQTRLFWLFLVAQLCFFASVIAPSSVYSAEKIRWKSLPTLAVDISINSDGQAYIAALNGTPWRWDKQEQRWRRMSGKFTRIAAAEDNHPWAINAESELFRYNGLWWERKHEGVADVAANIQGDVFITMDNGDIKQWYALRSEWRSINGSAQRIAVDSAGQLWIVDSEGKVQSYESKNWKNYSNIIAADIATSGENDQIIVDSIGFIRRWDPLAEQWHKVEGITAVNSVAVTPSGDIWAVLESGEIIINGDLVAEVEQAKLREPKAVIPKAPTFRPPTEQASIPKASVVIAPTLNAPAIEGGTVPTAAITHEASVTTFNGPAVDPATVTSRNPINFINTRENAASLAIGAEGSVFALTEGGTLLRWSNGLNGFTDFPGSLVRIAVDSKGNPWGISSLGRVFRHTGRKWQQILNVTASDIAASYDGSVVIVDSSGRLFKFNDTQQTFNAIFGNNAALVALEPDGTPWTVRTDKLVQRCNTSPCKRYPQKAQSIAIGPDGSVYIVSESKKLMHLDRLKDTFQLISIAGFPSIENVAVGPEGYPWVTSSDQVTLASAFFERDESGDALLAAITPEGGTVGTGVTSSVVSTEIATITFSKNMKFKNINNTLSIGGGDFNILEVGNDGSIWAAVLAAAGNKYEKYNENRNRFEAVPFWFATNNLTETTLSFDVTSNGDFWGSSNGTNVYRVRGQQSIDFTKSGVGFPSILSVGGDDTVYVVYGTSLYSKAENSNQFKKFSNDNVRFVSAGSGGNLWITNVADQVQQWTGSRFENRPMGQIQLAKSVKVGNGGTVYIVEAGVPYKWNATNNSFDKINNIQLTMDGEIAVEADGRLWLLSETDNTLKRAKD